MSIFFFKLSVGKFLLNIYAKKAIFERVGVGEQRQFMPIIILKIFW